VAADVAAPRRDEVVARDARAMGTDLRVVLVGPRPGAPDRAVAAVGRLESWWSRFRADSEITRLNAAGELSGASAATCRLVVTMCEAWDATGGLVDASVLDAVEALGYRTDLAQLPAPDPVLAGVATTRRGARVPGLAGVRVDRRAGSAGGHVRLPTGVRLDPGGIGKGLAADLVATALVADGHAVGALVGLGGDLRVVGTPPAGGWVVALEAPAGVRLPLAGGGVASSSTRRRRWRAGDGGTAHHVVDPRTGRAAAVPRTDATAVAPTAWQAEALATAALLAGPDHPAVVQVADAWGGAALALDVDGDLVVHDTLAEALRW
jgi:thiamine biosynthesis lipoprotein